MCSQIVLNGQIMIPMCVYHKWHIPGVYVCMYVCMCMHACMYIHARTHARTHIHTYMHAYIGMITILGGTNISHWNRTKTILWDEIMPCRSGTVITKAVDNASCNGWLIGIYLDCGIGRCGHCWGVFLLARNYQGNYLDCLNGYGIYNQGIPRTSSPLLVRLFLLFVLYSIPAECIYDWLSCHGSILIGWPH